MTTTNSKTLRLACGLSSVVFTAACAGTYDDMARFAHDLSADMHHAEMTAVEDMPQEGSATYRGYGGLNPSGAHPESLDKLEVLAEVKITADFADSELSGEMFGFVDEDNNRLDGRVKIANGSIYENTIEADISGEITNAGEAAEIDGGMSGQFRGDDAQYLGAYIYGTSTVGEEKPDFGGLVAAEKQ